MSVGKYKITFHHLSIEKYLGNDFSKPEFSELVKTVSHVTLAKLWDYSVFPRKLLNVGMSKCSWKDQFSRPIGRKLAMQRLMEVANLSKQERTVLWQVYFPPTKSEHWYQTLARHNKELLEQNIQLKAELEKVNVGFSRVRVANYIEEWLNENPDVDVEYGDLGIITGG